MAAAESTPVGAAAGGAVPAMRVLHAPLLVGGNPGQLALAEREIGLHSRCISFARHPFGYPCDEVLWESPRSVAANELKRLHLLWRAVREFDVVHFNFGTPILPKRPDSTARPGGRAWGLYRSAYNCYASLVEFRDLALLKKAGKALFVTYQGDDARQGAYCKAHFAVSPIGEVDAGYYTAESDASKRREITIFERYADGIFALNPDLLHVLPPRARFLPYAHVDPREWRPVAPRGAGSRPLVVHAPSHRGVKGTRFILDAVSRLRAEGVEFDFTLVEGMRNEDVRRIYEKADLLIDQLLVGWYGGVAVEFMAMGKPVICYVRDEDLGGIEPEMRSQMPIIRAEPSTLHDVLKEHLTARRHQLPEIGARARAYVERWHDPLRIARFLQGQYAAALGRSEGAIASRPPRPAPLPAITSTRTGPKRVLVISLTDLARDPRVHRQISALSARYRVLAAGTAPPAIEGVQFFRIPPREPRTLARQALSALSLKLGRYERYYWSQSQIQWCLSALADVRPDVIIANDVGTLPLALKLNSESGVILDAHEYSPLEYEDSLSWKFFFQGYYHHLCESYLPSVDAMITVCQSIADEYRVQFGVTAQVVLNTPPYHDLRPSRLEAGIIRMVHHGGAAPSRRLELMIETMDLLDDRFRLDMYLVPAAPGYIPRLQSLVANRPRVRILPPVPMHELPARLNRYDVGLYLLPPNSLNNLYALPNKFFEFIQARLAVAIGPSPEMARLVHRYGCGVVAEDFAPRSLARQLSALGHPQIDRYKQQSHEAAKELCFERSSEVLLNTVDRVVGSLGATQTRARDA